MESVVDDDNNVSEDVFINIDVIKDICKNYSIDTDRIYTTGQSMGGILSFFYATYFNDIFAAYMPVGSQFDNNMVKRLKNRNIIYLVPEGVKSNNEHMYSFDYAYKIDAAREYLFTKTKNNDNQQEMTLQVIII